MIERLLQTDAVSAGSAQSLENLRAIEERRLRRLISAGVVREAAGGRYYLFAPALAAHMANRRVRVLVATLIVATLALAMAAFTTFMAAR